jgi:sensor domain CHASE-containing protein
VESVVPSARSQIAGESKRSRWDRSRASLVLPIGVIVAVAIVCVIVAVLTSAQRADEVSFNNEQQLVRQAMLDHGLRALHLLQGAAATSVAATKIRDNSDMAWMDKRFGPWLEQYFHSDVEVIVDAGDRILYSHALDPADNDPSRLAAALAPNIDLMRGRLRALPEHTIPVQDVKDPARPGRSSALMQRFLDHPAFVSAVAVGSDDDLAAGNAGAPIALAVKYVTTRLLNNIGPHLEMAGLRTLDDPAQAGGDRVMAVTDPQGGTIAAPLPALPGSRQGPALRSCRAWCRSSPWRWPASRFWSAW